LYLIDWQDTESPQASTFDMSGSCLYAPHGSSNTPWATWRNIVGGMDITNRELIAGPCSTTAIFFNWRASISSAMYKFKERNFFSAAFCQRANHYRRPINKIRTASAPADVIGQATVLHCKYQIRERHQFRKCCTSVQKSSKYKLTMQKWRDKIQLCDIKNWWVGLQSARFRPTLYKAHSCDSAGHKNYSEVRALKKVHKIFQRCICNYSHHAVARPCFRYLISLGFGK